MQYADGHYRFDRYRPHECDVTTFEDTLVAARRGLRLPLAVRIGTVLRAPGLALVICERHTAGTGPGGEEVKHRGTGGAVVRAQPDGTWRIAADA